jgi:3'5'-cyclic nucleotide phosphodiesterase
LFGADQEGCSRSVIPIGDRQNWVTPREDKIVAKGKGKMQTYWLEIDKRRKSAKGAAIIRGAVDASEPEPEHQFSGEKLERMIDLNVDMLLRMLEQIVARRKESGMLSNSFSHANDDEVVTAGCRLEEVQDIISMATSESNAVGNRGNVDGVELPPAVVKQLHDFVSVVSTKYRDNPFHNFEHCTHVALSVSKLMARIAAPSGIDLDVGAASNTLHDHTYGIASDPLIQFACVFSALIHDVDHTGVPNTQVIVENQALAAMYQNRSVAERNSLDIGWKLFMEEQYADLRSVLYTTDDEFRRFRDQVVSSVMATDIADKAMKEERNARWENAFCSDSDKQSTSSIDNDKDAVDRKASIVIEYLIQASDVAHTMQQWVTYRKWCVS